MTISNRRLVALFGILSCIATGCNSNLPLDSGQYSLGGNATMNAPTNENLTDARLANQIGEARQMERSGQLADALNRYVFLAQANPNNALVWHRMAVTYNKLGRQDHAATCYDHALTLEPMNAELLCDCGYGQFLQGDMASAEQFSREALAIDPSLQRARNNLGLVLAKSGNSNGAMEQPQMVGGGFNPATPFIDQMRQIPLAAQRQVPVVSAEALRASSANLAHPMAKATSPEPIPMQQPIVQPLPKPHIVAIPNAQPMPISVPSEAIAIDVPPQPKTNSLPIRESAAAVHDKSDSEAEVARLNYYATDPSAPADAPPAAAIGSALAKQKALDQPPKALTQPMQATRLDSKDESSGVKMTLSSGTEEIVRTVKRSDEPKQGAFRQMGDIE